MEENRTIVYGSGKLQMEQKRADKCSIIFGGYGGNCPMIFHHIRQYIAFIEEREREGCGRKVLDHLVKKTRVNAGRKKEPSYEIINSQSVKTVTYGDECGIDGKKQKVENDIL